jgi:PAS domain S-box-containing protein
MDKVLRVLHLEDNRDFISLVSEMFLKEGIRADIISVASFEDFTGALERDGFDVILADYQLPRCNGLQALQAARLKHPHTPFLLVSGTLGEEAAIESLRCGATDYVLKTRLERLVPAAMRAAKEARDRAQRKHIETELVRREKYFRTLMENSLDVLTILDRDAVFRYNSPSIKTVLGHDPQELKGASALEFVHAEDLSRVKAALTRTVEAPALRVTQQFRFHKKDGSWCPVEAVCQNRLSDPEIAGIVMNIRDVSDRQRVAEALEKSQASLTAAQRIAHLGSWELELSDLTNLEANEVRWSDETYRIFGYEPRAVTITNELFFESVHPDDRQRIRDAFQRAFETQEKYDLEHRIVLPNGEERVVRERAEFVFDAAGKPVCLRGIVLDITERKRLEEQLRQSQKMEAIGQLAGGVAHDFNNILTVIHGHASLLMADKNLSTSAARSAQQIGQAAERAAGLTRQLLTFSRRQVMQPRQLDLNEIVSDMTMMLGRILGEDIALQLNYWSQPAFVRADASMIEQVLLNLAVNARDAMPKGGRLAIKITTDHRRGHPDARAGDYVCLSVSDSGCGIPPENLRRIFEPFFTTKEVGKGTGLGLATVYGIVKQHEGWIEVSSEPGRGATFRVYLPASARSNGATHGDGPNPTPRGGSETILVVEDEAPVRELVCSVLTGYGYNVVAAESGLKALDVWKQRGDSIQLLLTDLVMPDKINGRELAARLQAERPHLKVIFTSGYSADVVGDDFVLQRGLHYLQKPYDPKKLAVTVRGCLDG